MVHRSWFDKLAMTTRDDCSPFRKKWRLRHPEPVGHHEPDEERQEPNAARHFSFACKTVSQVPPRENENCNSPIQIRIVASVAIVADNKPGRQDLQPLFEGPSMHHFEE
jgi:hypothetical protein